MFMTKYIAPAYQKLSSLRIFVTSLTTSSIKCDDITLSKKYSQTFILQFLWTRASDDTENNDSLNHGNIIHCIKNFKVLSDEPSFLLYDTFTVGDLLTCEYH